MTELNDYSPVPPLAPSQPGSGALAVMWLYTIAFTIASGLVSANLIYSGSDDWGSTSQSGTYFLWGAVGGAFSTLPFWALLSVGLRILRGPKKAKYPA